MAVHTLGNTTNTAHTLGTPVTPVSGVPVSVVGSNVVKHVYTEIDPVFDAWDRSAGITIEQSQITDGDTIVNLEDWQISETEDGLLIKKGDTIKTRIDNTGEFNSGGINFDYCLVRNAELDNTLSLSYSTLLTITDKTGQVLTIDNLPDYKRFDESGWVAMLIDPDKTTTPLDPTPPSGDYTYKYFCTIDRNAKTLTFDALLSLASWEAGDNIALYNPFINYTFVTDQTTGPLIDISGAPAWRDYQTYAGPMYRHSDGRFILLVNGFADGGTAALGYAYSTDMVTWTMGNADAPVWDPTADIPDCTLCQFYGSAYPLNDGTGRLYMMGSATIFSGVFYWNEPRIIYFDEDLTTFTYSDALLTHLFSDGYTAGSPVVINDVYHLPVLYVPSGASNREIRIYTSTALAGPYTLYQSIAKGSTANDGVAWSYSVGPLSIYDDGVKKFGLFDGETRWSLSATKGNRETSLIEYNEETGLWEISKKGPVIINPMYFVNLDGTYNWCNDHAGNTTCIFSEGGKAYLATHFRGTTPLPYQLALLELNHHDVSGKEYLPYEGAEKHIDLNNKNLTTTGTITAGNVSGSNTGDQDLSVLVPYTGATTDVDISGNDLTVDNITINDAPTDPTDAATKGYVDSVVASGITWLEGVIDIVTPLPGGASVGDRYIDSSDDSINEWNGASYDTSAAVLGDTVSVSTGPTVTTGWYNYNGAAWVYIGGALQHNDTTNKQGGAAGEYYHLSSAQRAEVVYVVTATADDVPTGLNVTFPGVTIGGDGSVSAYADLTWDAIVSDTLDVYRIRYKIHDNTYYNTGLTTKTNSITIEGLVPNTSYDFAVCSVNKRGIASDYCANYTGTTALNTTAPGDVTLNAATAGIQYVIIEWTHIANKDLSHYIVYRNTADVSGGASVVGTTKSNYFLDGGRTGGQIYYYWIKAVNTSGILSVNFSNSVNATPRNVVSADTNIAHQGWNQTCAFTATDADTVSWGAGIFTTSAGVSYNISAGNTGNMAAKTYIYLNIGVSTTAYQTTTTASTAVGDGKVMIAIAQNNTEEAIFTVMNDPQMHIDANTIVANSITASLIAAGTITATEIDTDTITSDNILSVGADKVLIDGAVYLSNWQKSGDVTKIDGGEISTNTINASSINFTDIADNGDIIATINSSAEGIQIEADNITISGATTFDPIGANGEVLIFPDANTGLKITDNASNSVFEAIIDGAHVGDVIIGNYAGGQGIFYDKSEASTTFQGTIYAGGRLWGAQPHIVRKAASANYRNENLTEEYGGGVADAWSKVKTIRFTYGLLGEARFYYEAKKVESGGPGDGTVQLRSSTGATLGVDYAPTGGWIPRTNDVTRDWVPGEAIEIWVKGSVDGLQVYIQNFRVGYDDNPIVEVEITRT